MVDKVRADLEAYRGRAVSDFVWKVLVDRGWVRDFKLTGQSLAWLDEQARRVEREKVGLSIDPVRGRVNSRHKALSMLFALDAERDRGLQTFRKKILRGRVIQEAQIGEWIRGELRGAPSSSPRILTFPDESGYVGYVQVGTAGPLSELKTLAERFAHRYGWQEAQATGFVLTRLAPLVDEIRAETAWRKVVLTGFPAAPGVSTSALTRIVLTVDPRLSPKEVARAYQQWRGRLFRRHRTQSPKHLRLGLFALQREADEPWPSVLVRWNKSAPRPHRYKPTNVANFERDCLKAIERLLQPDYGELKKAQRALEQRFRATE